MCAKILTPINTENRLRNMICLIKLELYQHLYFITLTYFIIFNLHNFCERKIC